jgi:hypothetical protein
MALITPTPAEMRLLVRDPATAPSPYNLVLQEEAGLPQGQTFGAGTTLLFILANKPIVAASVYITQGTTIRQTAAAANCTVDLVNGLLTFHTAPSQVPLVDYNFNFFQDADYQEFIYQGMRLVGLPGNLTQTVDELLAPAVYEGAKAAWYAALATTYANRYKSTGGGMGQDVDAVTANYMKLGAKAEAEAIAKANRYYTRQGQNLAPSAHFLNYGIARITPRH